MSTTKAPMDRNRKIALAAGALYLATFATSIPALGLYDTALHDVDFLSGTGSVVPVQLGGFLELFCGLTGIGTAIVLYPILKRRAGTRAVGFVAARTLEAATIVVGILAMLAMITLRDNVAAGTDVSTVTGSWQSLVAVHDWSFLLGPGFMPVFNALCLATVLYQTRLVPRIIPVIGMIGAPLLFVSSTVTLFGGWEQVSGAAMLLGLPIALWEFSLGVWMLVKGFSTTAPAVQPTMRPAAEYAAV